MEDLDFSDIISKAISFPKAVSIIEANKLINQRLREKETPTFSKEELEKEAIGFAEWKEEPYNYDGKGNDGKGCYICRVTGKFHTNETLYQQFKSEKELLTRKEK